MNSPTEKSSHPVKNRVFQGLERWARAIKSLSPTHVSARLRADAEASVVSAQILACLKGRSDEALTCSILNNAWEIYGAVPFKVAMSQQSWCVSESADIKNDLNGLKLISPAESLSMLESTLWIARLGVMVPKDMWSRRTHVSSALEWHADSRILRKIGMNVKSIGPLLRVCSSVSVQGHKWDQIFDVLSQWLVAPSKLEELACRHLLTEYKEEKLPKFEAWAESKSIAESIRVPQVLGLTTLLPAHSARRL